MRRISLVLAVVGLSLMACVCGGTGPQTKKPNAQVVPEKPGTKASADDKADHAAIAAYDQFPEPHKSQLIKDWKQEVAVVRKAIESDKAALSRGVTVVEREKLNKFISIRSVRLARLQKNDPPYVTRQAAERVAEYQEKTGDKEISEARAKRKAKAEAEAEAREEANRKPYEDAMEDAKRAYEKGVEKFKAEQTYAKAMKILRAAQREYDAAKEKAMKSREAAKAVVYPPDPVAKAVADAASRSEIAMSPDAVALLAAEDEARGIPYEVLENTKRKNDGKLIMSLLVSEAASRKDVMNLAEKLRREYAGRYSTISIFDSREACLAVMAYDFSYPEKKLSRHWLVVINADGDKINLVAEGRDH